MKRRGFRRAAFTLTEAIIVVGLIGLVTLPILYVFQFVMRTQATTANQALTRLSANNVVQQLVMDIQNTSRGRYNATPVNRLSTFGTGAAAGSKRVALLDTVNGERLTWTYDAATGLLTRQSENFSENAAPTPESKVYQHRFIDFRIEETTRADFESVTVTGAVDNETITGLRIVGRSFLTLNPYHTTYKEVDGNSDGSFANDAVGAEMFGRINRGDDPRWQYIFNVAGTFRNT